MALLDFYMIFPVKKKPILLAKMNVASDDTEIMARWVGMCYNPPPFDMFVPKPITMAPPDSSTSMRAEINKNGVLVKYSSQQSTKRRFSIS